jgi:DNA-binding LacI/PurR family transcriptional regulator
MSKRVESKIGTIVELARLAGVSHSTVSRALAGNPIIAEATRRRIRDLAAAHGFRVNQAASALRRGRAQAIGVVIPLGHEIGQHLSDPFFMALLGPLADALSDAGYDLLLSRIIPRGREWLEELIGAGRVAGVILIGQSDQLATIEATAQHYDQMVVWGAKVLGAAQITVGTDNFAGGRLAAEHLLRCGRRRLAFLGDLELPEFEARYRGFEAAVGGVNAASHYPPVQVTAAGAYREAAAFLASNPAPDGIVAAADVIAIGAMRALSEHGLRVPDDVAIVGYDDIALAEHTAPPLTTIRQDVGLGAHLLVELLLKRIAGEAVESIELPPELVVRAST